MRHGSKLRRRSGGRRPLLAIIPILVLVAFTTGGCTKMTGGGWIPSLVPTEKATFGFSAKCKEEMRDGIRTAVLYEGQFQYKDRALDVNVHGDVEPIEGFFVAPGDSCRDLAAIGSPFGPGFGQFGGTFRSQSLTAAVTRGEFDVEVIDGGKPGMTLEGDHLTVRLFGDGAGEAFYVNFGVVQGGSITIQ